MTLSPNLRGIACMIMAGCTFVANDSFMKLVLADAPPMQVLFMRGAAASFGASATLSDPAVTPVNVSNPGVLRAACEIFAVTSFILALNHMPIGDITAIIQTAPLLVVIGVALIWGEAMAYKPDCPHHWSCPGPNLTCKWRSPYAVFGFLTVVGSGLRV